jgi:hypothetical protein
MPYAYVEVSVIDEVDCKVEREKVPVFVLLYCLAFKLSTDKDEREQVSVFVLVC